MQKAKPVVIKLNKDSKPQSLLGRDVKTSGMRSGQVSLNSGESVGEHSTEAKEEAIIILEGNALIKSDSAEDIHAEADSVVYMPPNTKHNVTNDGKSILRYVYVVSPITGKV